MTTMHCPICGTTMSSNNCEEGNDHRYVHRDIGDYYRFGDFKTGYWIDFTNTGTKPSVGRCPYRAPDRFRRVINPLDVPFDPKQPDKLIALIRALEAFSG